MHRTQLLALVALALLVGSATAEPIIKPRKYHGPIPRSSFSLRIGFLGGPENQEMIRALDQNVPEAARNLTNSQDFPNSSVTVDATWMYKLHPQFAVRANIDATFLRTDGSGILIPAVTNLPDSVLATQLDYARSFDVDLYTIEASGVYFFSDAAVQEFQPYIGGGFSVGIPHAKFKESRVDHDTGEAYPANNHDKWSAEPGVHGLLGAFYYFTSRWAASAEGRFQILQSKFPVQVFDPALGRTRAVNVDVKYSGFALSIGVTRSF